MSSALFWPIPFTHYDDSSEVVYIDHDHLIHQVLRNRDARRERRIEQQLDCGGSVEDDHRESRSDRTALAADTRVFTGARPANRACRSGTLGRSASACTSRSRYKV